MGVRHSQSTAAPSSHRCRHGVCRSLGCNDDAKIFCIHTGGDPQGWKEVRVNFPLVAHDSWCGNTVITHEKKLWWVDSSTGILCGDPFATTSIMIHVPLPKAKQLPGPNTLKRRCTQLSSGKIRVVMLEGWGAAEAIIKQWTLVSGQAGEDYAWEPKFELPLVVLHAHSIQNSLL